MIDIRCRRCGAPAAAIMFFDCEERRMWLEELTGLDPEGGIEFCAIHAAGRTAPVGWTLTDERTAARPLFAAVDVA